MNNKLRMAVTLLGFAIICGSCTAETQRTRSPEQVDFSAEDSGVKKPVAVPEVVMDILRKDKGVLNILESENISAEKLPASWFSAATIHLSTPEQKDLVVMGTGPLRGANVITFWVFCAVRRGYKLVMTAPAHDLTVKNTRWKGHRDIELTSMTVARISTVLCRYDGKRYEGYKAASKMIR
jgi:hypothetical protein